MIYSTRKPNPRAEYRLRRNERVNSSLTLAQKFPVLKKLSVSLEHFDPGGFTRTGGMTCKLNMAHAKSVLCFNCVYLDCVGGDFDLTKELAQAISAGQKSVDGETRCQGIRHNKDRKDPSTPCQSILRYKLTLGY
jgi:hypothetical protein